MNLYDIQQQLNAKDEEIAQLRAVLLAYERWEADLILCGSAWKRPGSDGMPVIPEHLWDRLLEIQEARNEALEGRSK